MTDITSKRCGFIALIGRPNVGKSTLLNHLLGQKISITSRKPQTTRHRLLGISTQGNCQQIFVDTPGLHGDRDSEKALNRLMNKTVTSVIHDVDVIIFVTDSLKWSEGDELVLEHLRHIKTPVILVMNKSDEVQTKEDYLPVIKDRAVLYPFAEILPLSALKGHNVEQLRELITRYLPESDFLFSEDQVTDRNSRFIAAEFVREKITRQLGQELPYGVTVDIEQFDLDNAGVLHISALIFVERKGQKKILIGAGGEKLKLIGAEARREMEKIFDSKVMLRLWVKVKEGWSDDVRVLKSLGYYEE